MRQKRKLRSLDIGVVCEGTKTENVYFFQMFDQESSLKGVNYRIIPKEEESGNIERANNKRSKRTIKKSKLNIYHELEELDEDTYKKYKAQPLRYVREAYLLKEDFGLSEVWAVFDKDGHPSLQEAFEKAEQWGVNIAFSSLSFEQWVLLHYEKSCASFHIVACKNKTKSIDCNKIIPCINPDDECLCGYIRRNYYHNYSKSDTNIYRHLRPYLEKAIENSAWLRNLNNNITSKVYDSNPYCDMDKFVLRLLNLKSLVVPMVDWFNVDDMVCISGNIEITAKLCEDTVVVCIYNSSRVTFVLDCGTVFLSTEKNNNIFSYKEKIIVSSEESKCIEIFNSQNTFRYLNILYEGTKYLCDIAMDSINEKTE
ncbi:MAG: RloB family protein [Rikenellaceae bacterium]